MFAVARETEDAMFVFHRRSILVLARSSWFPSSTPTTAACEPTRWPYGREVAPSTPPKLTASIGPATPAQHYTFATYLDGIVR
jgi:hypothetical protein